MVQNRATASGRPFVAIPGPSPVPDSVLRAMHRPSPDIYGPELFDMTAGVFARLKALAGTSGHLAGYIGNGHAVWEAATANLFSPGDLVLVPVSGHFGRSWAGITRAMGVEVEEMQCGLAPCDPQALADRLARDREGRIRAVLVTQIDTQSAVRNDLAALRRAMGSHPALLVVDAIASFGCEPLRMDEWGVDVAFAASQKGLMTPPGMAFLWFRDGIAQGSLVTPYWNWTIRSAADESWKFWGGTPPVQLVYALDEALRLIEEETPEAVYTRHEALAHATWAAFDAWGAGSDIRMLIGDPQARARSVTAAHLRGSGRLRDWVRDRANLTLGVALGADRPEDGLRVAHMGHVSAHAMLGTLATMEAGMRALDIPHGPGGTEAAIDRIASSHVAGSARSGPASATGLPV